jgi:cyanate lyase
MRSGWLPRFMDRCVRVLIFFCTPFAIPSTLPPSDHFLARIIAFFSSYSRLYSYVFTLQAKFPTEDLAKLASVLDLDGGELTAGLGEHWWPNRGLGQAVPRDPVIYRLYEGVLVYGHAIKVGTALCLCSRCYPIVYASTYIRRLLLFCYSFANTDTDAGLQAVIHEKFGDGIMSMIDCKVNVTKKPDPKGDRVLLTFE